LSAHSSTAHSSTAQSSSPDWLPARHDQRAASGFAGVGRRAPSAWQDPVPGPETDRGASRNASGAAAQSPATAPRAWAAPGSPPASADTAPSGTGAPGARDEADPPSWFDRLGTKAGADAATSAPGSGGGWPWPSRDASTPSPSGDGAPGEAPASATAGDEDDDWPTRYSWLEDETDESGEPEQATEGAGQARDEAEPARNDDAAPEAAAPADTAPEPFPAPSAPPTVPAPAMMTGRPADFKARGAETVGSRVLPDPGLPDRALPGSAASAPGDADTAGPSPASDPGQEAEPEAEGDAEAVTGAAGEPPAGQPAAPAPTGLVSVVRGVPRYHEPECVLIRFMPDSDVQRLTIPQAKNEGCTPCAACQPPG
jgi:hypothetical protein